MHEADSVRKRRSDSKNKLYALHAPEVECLAKGKARTPYEFGVKVSITSVTHKEGLVVGMRSMPGNPYDGHTLAEALVAGGNPERHDARGGACGSRGYQGVAIDGVKIYRPAAYWQGITRGLRAKLIRRRKRDQVVEPTIGHMKTDGKLDENWLKGALGDAMHAVLCGAGHNTPHDPEDAAAFASSFSLLPQSLHCRRRDGVTPAPARNRCSGPTH